MVIEHKNILLLSKFYIKPIEKKKRKKKVKKIKKIPS